MISTTIKRNRNTITWRLAFGRYHLLIGGTVVASETDMQPGGSAWTGERIRGVAAYAEHGGRLILRDDVLFLDSIPLTAVGAVCRDPNYAASHWTEELLKDIIERCSS